MKELDGRIIKLFSKHNIEYVSAIPFEKCKVINKRKLDSLTFEPRSVIVFAMPYFVGVFDSNISLYASPRDYHIYARQLFDRICPEISNITGGQCRGFSDSSPIDEVDAAAMCGVGVLGDNGMLITEKYSSFVFLGCVLCDVPFDDISDRERFEIIHCEGCGRCQTACPRTKYGVCLSELTQKKGELTFEQKEYIKKYGTVWGCDICQLVCPHTQDMIRSGVSTPIEFFKHDIITSLDKNTVETMSDSEFSQRAFAWRGRQILLRNLSLWEE